MWTGRAEQHHLLSPHFESSRESWYRETHIVSVPALRSMYFNSWIGTHLNDWEIAARDKLAKGFISVSSCREEQVYPLYACCQEKSTQDRVKVRALLFHVEIQSMSK